MPGEDRKYIRTWEELVMDRMGQAFHAKDQNNPELFDNILEEIEMLVKLVPGMHEQLQSVKEHKKGLVKKGVEKAKEKAMACPDDITKEFVYRKEIYAIEWDYRTDMLSVVLSLLNDYQRIAFSNPDRTEMYSVKDEEPETTMKVEEPKKKEIPKERQTATFEPIKE